MTNPERHDKVLSMPSYKNMLGTPLQRFWDHIQVDANGCWLWTGHIAPDGYARFRPEAGLPTKQVHRWAYEQFSGPISEETLDHLCKVRHCSFPGHLEPVTRAENMRRSRRTHCRYGHAYDYVWTDPKGNPHNRCRTCVAAAQKRYQQRKKEED